MPKPAPVAGLGPDTPLVQAARRLVAARLDDVRHFGDRVGAQRDIDPVHHMRVAARRLRVAMTLLGGDLFLDEERATKQLQDALGAVRDIQVMTHWIEQSKPGRAEESETHGRPDPHAVGAAGRTALNALRDEESHKFRQRERELVHELAAWTKNVAEPLTARLLQIDDDAIAGRFGGKTTRRALSRLLRRVEEAMDRAIILPDAATAHALRIVVKKTRYAAELVHAVAPRTIDILLAALEPLQESLGQLHDADVRAAQLRDFSLRASPKLRAGALEIAGLVDKERVRMAQALSTELTGAQAEHLIQRLGRLIEEP